MVPSGVAPPSWVTGMSRSIFSVLWPDRVPRMINVVLAPDSDAVSELKSVLDGSGKLRSNDCCVEPLRCRFRNDDDVLPMTISLPLLVLTETSDGS